MKYEEATEEGLASETKENHDCAAQPSCNRTTSKIQSFTDPYHKQQNGVLQCIEIPNACETHKEERFLTI